MMSLDMFERAISQQGMRTMVLAYKELTAD